MSRRTKAVACIHCRQMKLRCDAHESFPASCTRCSKNQLRCSIDPSFRRTARRQRIDAIEKELQELKAAVDSTSIFEAPQSTGDIDQDSSNNHPDIAPSTAPSVPFASTVQHSTSKFESQRIGEIHVDSVVIAHLVDLYYLHYQSRLPILPTLSSFAKSYYSCPLLFWTVIALASEHSPEHSSLYSQLAGPVELLACDIRSASNQPLGSIQALLILCWWPFPFGATNNDPSWTYCGLAIHAALRIGLHRPHHRSDFIYQLDMDDEDLIVCQKTWLACFITNQELSSRLGVPSTVRVDNSIIAALSPCPAWLPSVLYQYLRIAYHSLQTCHTLGNYELTTTGILPDATSIIRMFDAQYLALEHEFRSEWTTATEIAFLRAKLHLFSFACNTSMSRSTSESQDRISSQVSDILAQAYLSALKLVQLTCDSPTETLFWSASLRGSLAYAVFFLIKLATSSQDLFVDQNIVRNSISQVWNLLHSKSSSPDDHLSRICAIIEYLSKSGGSVSRDSAQTVVESRMSANLPFDAIWRARGRFSKEIRDIKPADYTTAAHLEQLRTFDLDFLSTMSYVEGDPLIDWSFAWPSANV